MKRLLIVAAMLTAGLVTTAATPDTAEARPRWGGPRYAPRYYNYGPRYYAPRYYGNFGPRYYGRAYPYYNNFYGPRTGVYIGRGGATVIW